MKKMLAIAALAVLALTGCTPALAYEPAEFAADPGCADVIVHTNYDVADLPLRETNAQGVTAWGNPAAVILRCGVAEPEPTSTLPCVQVDDVFWLRDDTDAPNYVFTTYGRSPATEVVINRDVVSPGAALYALTGAIGYTESTGSCTEVEDTLGNPTDAD